VKEEVTMSTAKSATRREFLKTSAGVAAVISGSRAGCFAEEADEEAPENKEHKTARPEDERPPLRLHLLGCG